MLQAGGTVPPADPARARPRPCATCCLSAARPTTTAHPDGRHSTGTGALAQMPRVLLPQRASDITPTIPLATFGMPVNRRAKVTRDRRAILTHPAEPVL